MAEVKEMVPLAKGWLQVGNWVYPLIPGHSPVLQTSYGAYMFPDTTLQTPGAAVGLLLPDSVEQDVRLKFENILCELTACRREGVVTDDLLTAEEARMSEKISAGIMKGAELFAKGVGYGAVVTSKLVHQGAERLRKQINPNNIPPPEIDPRVQKGLKVAREVTGVAVTVSSFVVRRLGEATLALGRVAAPHIRHHGSVFLSKALGADPKLVDNKLDDVLEVASGGGQRHCNCVPKLRKCSSAFGF